MLLEGPNLGAQLLLLPGDLPPDFLGLLEFLGLVLEEVPDLVLLGADPPGGVLTFFPFLPVPEFPIFHIMPNPITSLLPAFLAVPPLAFLQLHDVQALVAFLALEALSLQVQLLALPLLHHLIEVRRGVLLGEDGLRRARTGVQV